MVGAWLVRTLYALPTRPRTVRLIEEYSGLGRAIGGTTPSEWACYRFLSKLLAHSDALAACLRALRTIQRGHFANPS